MRHGYQYCSNFFYRKWTYAALIKESNRTRVQYHGIYKKAVTLHWESFEPDFGSRNFLSKWFNWLFMLLVLLLSMKQCVLQRSQLLSNIINDWRLGLNLFACSFHFLNTSKWVFQCRAPNVHNWIHPQPLSSNPVSQVKPLKNTLQIGLWAAAEDVERIVWHCHATTCRHSQTYSQGGSSDAAWLPVL